MKFGSANSVLCLILFNGISHAAWRFLIRLNLLHIVIGQWRFCAAVAQLRVPFILACGKYRRRLKNLNIQFKRFEVSKQQQQQIETCVELMLNIEMEI